MNSPIIVPLPKDLTKEERVLHLGLVARESTASSAVAGMSLTARASFFVLRDLLDQGWKVEIDGEEIVITPVNREENVLAEKERVRRQEVFKRDEQLRNPSVRRFILDMEKPREFEGRLVSVFNLMRDGGELLRSIDENRKMSEDLKSVVDPYLQFVDSETHCVYTGLRLMDVWRYFRHTWSNQYASTPGRSMAILIRDRAAQNHPVIGIAAVGSAIVQLSERDRFIGWNIEDVLADLEKKNSLSDRDWLLARLNSWLDELYCDDLIADGLFRTEWWSAVPDGSIEALQRESELLRQRHQLLGRRSDFRKGAGGSDETWIDQARTDLYRSKRCDLLSELLRCRRIFGALDSDSKSIDLSAVLRSVAGRSAAKWIIRRAKAETVGTEIADITVCGAIAPYSHLLGGKLVCCLLASPSVVRAYASRYSSQPSQIASSLAGRPIVRSSNLVFLGTTSLYGSGSSQYNRINIPSDILMSDGPIEYIKIGKSKAFGTSHLSQQSVDALTQLGERGRNGARVKSIFGEGASPKLRKIREGLLELNWPANELLQHQRERLVYGVPLIANLGEYLLGRTSVPQYRFDVSLDDDTDRLAAWWRRRWLRQRIERSDVRDALVRESLSRPVMHGARVVLPPNNDDSLFPDFVLEE